MAEDIQRLIRMPLAQSVKRTAGKQVMIAGAKDVGQKLSLTNPSSKIASKLKYHNNHH